MNLSLHDCTGAECPHCAVLPVGRVAFGQPRNFMVSIGPPIKGLHTSAQIAAYEQRQRELSTFHDSLGHIPASYPKALLPSITAIIQDVSRLDAQIYLLCHQRMDNQQWGFVGGAQNLGESIIETVHREVREETGLEVRIDGLVCVDSDPTQGAICSYDDGTMHYTNLCFACTWIGGELRCSDESLQLAWCAVGDVPQPFLGTHAWRLQEWSKSNMRGHRGVTVR